MAQQYAGTWVKVEAMQDDQGSSEGQIPEESGSGADGADSGHGTGDQASPGPTNAASAGPGDADHGSADAGQPAADPADGGSPGPFPARPGQAGADVAGRDLPGPGQPRPFYGTRGYPAPGYGPPGSGAGYGPPASDPGYGRSGPGYGSGQPGQGYGQSDPSFDQPAPGYLMSAGGYGGPPDPGHGARGSGQDYGQPGYGYTTPRGYPGGYGQSGGYYPAPGTRARRRRTLLTYVTVAVVAAALGAGVTGLAINTSPAGGSPSGGQRANPGPNGGLPGDGTSGAKISGATKRAVVNAVKPGLVDISSNLQYQGSQAAATGMVISSDGLVLTNNHVITGTTQLSANVLTTHRRYAAKWLGYDATDDVAVIKLIGARNLKTVPLGNSDTVGLGDRVIAIGNAYGAGRLPAVVGKITGKNRTITASDSGAATKETLHGMLQTNAGIVQGDSGGPLASTSGRVIGMDTAAATGSFGSTTQNVGFAIPINKALRIARQIISGKPGPNVQIGSTGFMGVLVPAGQASTATSPVEQRNRQLKQDQGASGFPAQPSAPFCLQNQESAGVPSRVAPVASGALIIGELCSTPAQRAGIIAGDVITSVGGQKIDSPKQLTGVMMGFKPGSWVNVTWVDVNGQQHTGKLRLVQAPPR
jgi:S1-C subfamily serine protease